MRLRSAFLLQVMSATVPALLFLISIPLVRARLDLENFAGFTLMLSTVGLLTVLDGGLGRASTYFISLSLARGGRRRAISVFHGVLLVGLSFSLVLGCLAAVAVQLAPGHAFQTARTALMILVGFTPLFIASSLLRGFLEAEQRFGSSSSLQLAHGTLIASAPALLFSVSNDLATFAWVIGFGRIALTLAFLFYAGLWNRKSWIVSRAIPAHAKRVFGYTKWLFLSNLIGLTIVFADRFVVASFFSSAVVVAYVLPMEMIARMQVLTTAFCTVLFPRLVASAAAGTAAQSHRFVSDAQGAFMAATAVFGFAAALVSGPLMRWWLGEPLAIQAARVLVVGIVGVGLIASAALAMIELNSSGRTRPAALLHSAEMPIYILLLFAAAKFSSIELLLITWIVRLSVDAIGMNFIALRGARSADTTGTTSARVRSAAWAMVVVSLICLLMLGLTSNSLSLPLHAALAITGMGIAAIAGRHFIASVRLSKQISN